MLGILLLLNVVTVYAGTALYGYFKDYKIVKLLINGEELDSAVPSFLIDHTTVIPLRDAAEALNAFVIWDEDTQTANLIKPNVNMQFTANPIYDEKKQTYVVYSPFGKIPTTKRYHLTFYVYTEVDNLPKEWIDFKVVLKDPDGEVLQEGKVHQYNATVENSLQYIDRFKEVDFVKTGNYTVEFLLKSESTKDEYFNIGEKHILVK